MSNTTTESPISRRIVLSFLDFLNSVEPTPGADLEGLEVAKDCLLEVFNLNSSSVDDLRVKPDSLVEIFSSLELIDQKNVKLDRGLEKVVVDALPSSSTVYNGAGDSVSVTVETSKSQGNDRTSKSSTLEVSKDELLGQFVSSLEKINFLKTSADGHDDPVQLDKATRIFENALTEMERSGCQIYNQNNLADSLKTQGNKALQSSLYSDAIELYTCAIAICETNAIYYCNRAAAFTQVHKYIEAIEDCHKSIEIDPSYSKAYSRLGLVYYAQGNYGDAISKGFKKALRLDPTNEHVKENIRVAEAKLREELPQFEFDQNTGTGRYTESMYLGGSSDSRTQFHSFDSNIFSADISSMFMNMASNAQNSNNAPSHPDEPIRIPSNIFGENMPQDLSGTMRSVMDMFSGVASQPEGNNPQDNSSRSSTRN